jgi:hypothetical protein
MPQVTFQADTHAEIVAQVRRWLASLDADEDGSIDLQTAISQGADITKDALRVVASVAPAPIAQSDVVKALTDMGYKATDATRDRLREGLANVEAVTGGSVVRRVGERGREAVFEMNATIAKQLLRALSG